MKRTLIIFALAVFAGLNIAAQDTGEPSPATPLIAGYGETKWGDSAEAVGAVVPDLKAGRTAGAFSTYATTHGKAEQTTFQFFDDHLFHIDVTYRLPNAPAKGRDEAGGQIIQSMIEKKYTKNPEVAPALMVAGISVLASPKSDGTIVVIYENTKIIQAINVKKRAARAEAVEIRREGVESFGIEDEL